MAQDQHFLAQVYLRRWCVNDRLLRYRGVGPDAKLELTRKFPRSVAFVPDLYKIPDGATANGLKQNQLEETLAREVDERLPKIAALAASVAGRVEERSTADAIRWLMNTFVVRGPERIAKVETSVAEFLREQAPILQRMMDRATTAPARNEVRQYLDRRMPSVAARAGVAAMIAKDSPDASTPEGASVHVLHLNAVGDVLQSLGANEFVTYEEPVVSWDGTSYKMLTSFALSPEVLIIVFAPGASATIPDYRTAAWQHTIAPIAHRQNLFCRTQVAGRLLREAAESLQSSHPASTSRGQ